MKNSDNQKNIQSDKEKDIKEEEQNEWREKYLRALADYHNIVKRLENEKEIYRDSVVENILKKLLPVVDSLALLRDHSAKEKDKNAQAIDLIWKLFMTTLEGYSLKSFSTIGMQFDPHTMECVEVITNNEVNMKDNCVSEEIQNGYMLGESKLLRPALVKVYKKKV